MHAGALEVTPTGLALAHQVLDRFDLGARLQHVRQFVWRGGSLRLEMSQKEKSFGTQVCYALVARWPDAILQGDDVAALVRTNGTVVDGRWVRGESGYALRAGIDLAVPSAIAIRSDRHASFIPFHARPPAEVERALEADLAAYVQQFLATCPTVPQAVAAGAERLRRLGL
jgi:hypothetical protein